MTDSATPPFPPPDSGKPDRMPCDRLPGEDVRHLSRHVENLSDYRELGQCAAIATILQRWPLLAEVEGEAGTPATVSKNREDERCAS